VDKGEPGRSVIEGGAGSVCRPAASVTRECSLQGGQGTSSGKTRPLRHDAARSTHQLRASLSSRTAQS
jgi:hypothetical protein